MPPKPKFTKEDIIDAALDIIRESNLESITAQSVAKKIGTSTSPVFTYFNTLEDLRNAAVIQAREMYNVYAERGLAMTPAFKGFAMEYIKFAMDEPSLFRLLFMRKANDTSTVMDFLDREGHLETILDAVIDIFHIDREQAKWLYDNLWSYAHGLAALCASEVMRFSDEELAERLGTICRALVISLQFPKDERTKIIPKQDLEISGKVEEYVSAHE